MRYIIDLRNVDTREDLHALLKQALALPDYYGGNLDALYDILSEGGEEREIRFLHAEEAGEALREKTIPGLRRVCADLTDSVTGFSAVWE